MLQRIRRDQVKLGMFIESFDCSWFGHPFWRHRFLLSDPADLETLRDSGVDAILIDDAKGLGVAPAPSPVAPAPSPTPRRSAPSRGAAREFARAVKIVERSKEQVKKMFAEARLGKAIEAAGLAPLVDEIAESVARNPSALLSVARLKARHEYTYMHSIAVCALMINLARRLKLDEALIRDIGMAGMLHDVGKMAVPDSVLNKAGKLTPREFATVKTHPERGHALLKKSGGVPDIALDVCLHHHERVDGSGYPHGLKGDEISLFARMAAVCDVYDAITSNRSYKDAWTPADALANMIEWRGHFDTAVLGAFIQSIGIYPIGTLVRLSSGRLAVVINENPDDLTRPLVRAFYSIEDKRHVPLQDVRPSNSAAGDRIVGQEDPGRWGFTDWSSRCTAIIAGPAES